MDFLLDFLLNFYGPTPYLLIFAILLACGLGLPIPEDITLFTAGLLSYYGVTRLGWMIVICYAGVMIGDITVFWLGAHYGRKLTKKWFFKRLLPEDRLQGVRERFKKRGNKLIFAARFMPGLRAPIFFSAGTLHLPYRVFFFYDGLAALLSVPAIVWAVYHYGDELERVVRLIQRIEHSIVFVVVAAVGIVALKWGFRRYRQKKSKTK